MEYSEILKEIETEYKNFSNIPSAEEITTKEPEPIFVQHPWKYQIRYYYGRSIRAIRHIPVLGDFLAFCNHLRKRGPKA